MDDTRKARLLEKLAEAPKSPWGVFGRKAIIAKQEKSNNRAGFEQARRNQGTRIVKAKRMKAQAPARRSDAAWNLGKSTPNKYTHLTMRTPKRKPKKQAKLDWEGVNKSYDDPPKKEVPKQVSMGGRGKLHTGPKRKGPPKRLK